MSSNHTQKTETIESINESDELGELIDMIMFSEKYIVSSILSGKSKMKGDYKDEDENTLDSIIMKYIEDELNVYDYFKRKQSGPDIQVTQLPSLNTEEATVSLYTTNVQEYDLLKNNDNAERNVRVVDNVTKTEHNIITQESINEIPQFDMASNERNIVSSTLNYPSIDGTHQKTQRPPERIQYDSTIANDLNLSQDDIKASLRIVDTSVRDTVEGLELLNPKKNYDDIKSKMSNVQQPGLLQQLENVNADQNATIVINETNTEAKKDDKYTVARKRKEEEIARNALQKEYKEKQQNSSAITKLKLGNIINGQPEKRKRLQTMLDELSRINKIRDLSPFKLTGRIHKILNTKKIILDKEMDGILLKYNKLKKNFPELFASLKIKDDIHRK